MWGAENAEIADQLGTETSRLGVCKLCLEPKVLQESHLLGRAIYKMCREEGGDPVVMTPELVMSTSRQLKDFAFCWDCEQKFSRNGEEYVSRIVRRQDSFPLLDRLNLAFPHRQSEMGHTVYSGLRAGIDVEKLAYYGLSVLWRSAVHPWRTLGEQTTTVKLGAHNEEIREYLAGDIAFPNDIAVVITVCRDLGSQHLAFTPSWYGKEDVSKYAILVRGIYFRVLLGADAQYFGVCCMHSPLKNLFVEDCSKHSEAAFAAIHRNAKVARNVQKLKNPQ